MKRKSKLDRATDRLYTAAAHYVETLGGKCVVIGGVETMVFPSEPKFNFRLCLRITGHKPEVTHDKG